MSKPASVRRRSSGAPRLMDVASAAGVSHQTVSRVLNGSPRVRQETRDRVLQAIAALGYRRNSAARALVTNRSGRVGVIVAHLGERGPSTIASSLQEAAREQGYEAVFIGLKDLTRDGLIEAVDRLLDQAVEAIIVGVTHRESIRILEELGVNVPVVVVEGVDAARPLTAGVAQSTGGALGTGHLLDHGHESVAHVAGPLDWVEAAERRAGWLLAHEQRDRTPGPEWNGDWTSRSGYAAGEEIARDPSITAVFVANDQMALGLLLALHEHGRAVPEDVSVVGFDNLPEAAFFIPPLTTVHQDFEDLARRALDLAVRALSGEESPTGELIQPTLIERRSCAAPPPRPT